MAHHVLYANVQKQHILVIFMNSKDKESCKLSKTKEEGGRGGKITKDLEWTWHQTSDYQVEKLENHEGIAKIFWGKRIWKPFPGKLAFKYEGKMKIILNMQAI